MAVNGSISIRQIWVGLGPRVVYHSNTCGALEKGRMMVLQRGDGLGPEGGVIDDRALG